MKKIILLIIAIQVILTGCRLIQDFMNMSPPEILSFSPDDEYVTASELSEVCITFSQGMDKTKTEGAFSLTEGSSSLEGVFSWKENRLSFVPFSGFKTNKTYTIQIETTAEDRYGNSLMDEFYFTFFTGEEKNRPRIVGHSPAAGAVIANLLEPVIINFSEPVDKESLYSSFSISPEVQGNFTWNIDNSVVTFTPLESYVEGEEYRVEISTDLEDLSGNTLAEEFSFRFQAGVETDLVINSLTTMAGGTVIEDTSIITVNTGIEKDEVFLMDFNIPVPFEQTTGIFNISPSANYNLYWALDYESCTVSFTEYLEYGQVYEIVILENTYRIKIDGPNSLPLEVIRLTFCNDKTEVPPVFTTLNLNDPFPVVDSSTSCLDFYIHHATGASLNTGSFIDALSIDSDAVSFTLQSIENPANASTPPPNPPIGADVTVIRVNCEVSEVLPSGLVTISLDTDLKDSFNNTLLEEYIMQVNH